MLLKIICLIGAVMCAVAIAWCMRNASKGEKALIRGVSIDQILIVLCLGASASSFGYLRLLGDPIPKEVIPVFMGLIFLCSTALAPLALSLVFVHIKYARIDRQDGDGSDGASSSGGGREG